MTTNAADLLTHTDDYAVAYSADPRDDDGGRVRISRLVTKRAYRAKDRHTVADQLIADLSRDEALALLADIAASLSALPAPR